MKAYEDALARTSQKHAPWYVVPANKKWFRNLVVARTIADTLEAIDPRFPEPGSGLPHAQLPT
jgi:polyphosphate kinase 2 (PPK2 family)